MDPAKLIPATETIPAPPWLFIALGLLTFTLHILVINAILGGSLITLFQRIKSSAAETPLHEPVIGKMPTMFAVAVNLGVAPLLFLQVVYGHLFYSGSVLMGTFWILVIPLIIIAYYGAYIHARRYRSASALPLTALIFTSAILLYIGFMLVNNMIFMEHPETWTAYFDQRSGLLLNIGEKTLWPRYLHFVTASIAIGALFLALVWNHRTGKGQDGADSKARSSLKIFSWATVVQILIGFWFLLTIPRPFMMEYMGKNMLFTIIFMIGFLSPIGAVVTGFRGKLRPTLGMFLITMIAMVLIRFHLKTLYISQHFTTDSLVVKPQYGVMILFFAIFIIGLAIVGQMIKIAVIANRRRTA